MNFVKFDSCPYCKTETFEHPNTKYCYKCSKLVLPNKCSNEDCEAFKEELSLPPDAKYCPLCREETTNQDYLNHLMVRSAYKF